MHSGCVCACSQAFVCQNVRTRARPRAPPGSSLPGCAIEQVHGPLYAHSVCEWACACVHACEHARASQQQDACRAPPSSSLPCMQHPSVATEMPSAGGTGESGRGAERAGGVNPPRSAAPPTSSATLHPHRWCSSVAAMVWPSTSWCGGTSRRPGRKPPSLHGRWQGPTGPALPPSPHRLHSCTKQSLLSSHTQAWVVEGGGWDAVRFVE